MAGIVALFVAPGTVINHNHCHDIYSPGYCGGGFLTGSGSMNITFINNIAYDTSHNALKFDHGANIHVENNIFGFNDQAVLIWTSNTQGYHQWDILNNIFVFDSTIMMGAFDDSSADSLIDKNIYWHTLGPENINFRKTTWEYWRETRGYDHNSYIIDPLFVDHNNRNFNFINDSSYSLIDFKPFSLDFGVYGEKWWIDSANNYQYFDYHLAEKWQLESGYENFETNGNSYFWKQVVIDEQSSEIGITSENSCNGKKSLKFGITSSQNTNPTISIPANWYEGHSTFSLDIYMNNESSMYISLQQYNVIYLQKGKMKFINTEYINLPNKEWFNIKIKMNFGTVKESTKFDCQISGKDFNQTFNIYYRQDFSSITNIIIGVSESTDNIYIDNIHANIDQKHYQFFSQELEETNKLSSLFSNSGKSKISPGGIAGIVIGVIVIIIIAVIVVIFFIKRKNSNENSNDFHVHV
ncbi:hypothetical protein TRFO_38015 [Tritrichomonas foetus]|uniref:Right handed beta helix domain-containing protein n=1 Tax=Tritrichomonas foetus TaxID=1144522 RepID=A0A1J4J9J7_9EUKA|nr:hypothetical protein TRFO_38015 [Tritrichomonas foetus]|eukprot:OHS95832.1 hypothetical protein TRFO_38015 [Tritrichomonas foetus]